MLKYTGGGYGGAVYGIPARDLSDDDVSKYGGEALILVTGLYEKVGEKADTKIKQNKVRKSAKEDK